MPRRKELNMKYKVMVDELNKRLEKWDNEKCLNGWNDIKRMAKETIESYLNGDNEERLDVEIWGDISILKNNGIDIVVTVDTPFDENSSDDYKIGEIRADIEWDKRCTVKAQGKAKKIWIEPVEEFNEIDVVDLTVSCGEILKKEYSERLNNRVMELEEEMRKVRDDIRKVKDWVLC